MLTRVLAEYIATALGRPLNGLGTDRAVHAIAYAVQLASGIPCWLGEHGRIA